MVYSDWGGIFWVWDFRSQCKIFYFKEKFEGILWVKFFVLRNQIN